MSLFGSAIGGLAWGVRPATRRNGSLVLVLALLFVASAPGLALALFIALTLTLALALVLALDGTPPGHGGAGSGLAGELPYHTVCPESLLPPAKHSTGDLIFTASTVAGSRRAFEPRPSWPEG